jgi:hypothetical protein
MKDETGMISRFGQAQKTAQQQKLLRMTASLLKRTINFDLKFKLDERRP